MRRKANTLLSIEIAILAGGVDLLRAGVGEFYGYAIAKEIQNREGARRLTAHGTLYRALDRMEKAGLLVSRWEDPALGAAEERPRRRLYRVNAAGEQALQEARAAAEAPAEKLRRGLAPS